MTHRPKISDLDLLQSKNKKLSTSSDCLDLKRFQNQSDQTFVHHKRISFGDDLFLRNLLMTDLDCILFKLHFFVRNYIQPKHQYSKYTRKVLNQSE